MWNVPVPSLTVSTSDRHGWSTGTALTTWSTNFCATLPQESSRTWTTSAWIRVMSGAAGSATQLTWAYRFHTSSSEPSESRSSHISVGHPWTPLYASTAVSRSTEVVVRSLMATHDPGSSWSTDSMACPRSVSRMSNTPR